MYHSLLVPLDRSSFGEQALPLALSIARRANARLDLVEVHALYALDDPTAGRLPYEPELDAECKRQEQLYLDATAKWAASISPVPITVGLLSGSTVPRDRIADSILERAHASKADLVVMTTHSRPTLARFALGSVADELVRRATIPVLLVRPGVKAPEMIPEPVLDNILIPLDGSGLAEQVLEPTLGLARLMDARCSLLAVIPSGSSGACEPTGSPQATYLEHIAGRLRRQGLEVGTKVVIARHVDEAILDEADAQASNLIALATHGRGGFKRLLLGSVADKLVRGASSSVLVYRPTSKEL